MDDRLLMRALPWLALLWAGCLRESEFKCTTDMQCSPGGTCQTSVGHCSDFDSRCPTGQRFDELAGPYANQCVRCPDSYAPLPGASGDSHFYRRTFAALNWNDQRVFCAQTSPHAYLAVPDNLAELAGLAVVAGTSLFWVGISDQTIEGSYVSERGGPATFLLWGTGQPDNGGGSQEEDCVAVMDQTLGDLSCGLVIDAVCECEP